jgi:hypothetical protein
LDEESSVPRNERTDMGVRGVAGTKDTKANEAGGRMTRLLIATALAITLVLYHPSPIAADDVAVNLRAENEYLWRVYLEQCESNKVLLELLDKGE